MRILSSLIVLGLIAGAATADSTTPTVAAVQSLADFSTNLAPGMLAVLYGTNFGSGPATSVTVMVGGKQAYVVQVASVNQVVVQLPIDAPVGSANVTVAVGGVTSAAFPITLTTYAPAVFTADGSGTGPGLIRTSAGGNVSSTSPAKAGDGVVAYGTGFGPTNPAVPTGVSPTAPNPTTTSATVTVGGLPATVAYSGVTPGQVGTYQVNFTVPSGLQGTQPVIVTIGGKSSTPVGIPLFGISSVVNNASFGSVGTVSPGAIVSLYANGIGTTDQTVGFPGTSFQGVSVSFNGIPAPLFHLTASQGQIDLLVPDELPTSGQVNVQVKTASAASASFAVNMAPATPGLYFAADPATKGRLNVLAQFNNTVWLAMPGSMATALKLPGSCTAQNVNPLSLCGQPAAPGDYLVLYTTGLGKATPNGDPNGAVLKTGDVPPADGSVLYKTVSTPTVTVGGLAAQVVYSGLAPGFPGLYQVDFQVPVGVTGDDIPLALSIAGSATDTRTISVQQR